MAQKETQATLPPERRTLVVAVVAATFLTLGETVKPEVLVWLFLGIHRPSPLVLVLV
jgi:hypothetical protein